MEGVDVLVVVPQRPQRLRHLAEARGVLLAAVGQTRSRRTSPPSSTRPRRCRPRTKRVYCVLDRCSSYWRGVDQPAGPATRRRRRRPRSTSWTKAGTPSTSADFSTGQRTPHDPAGAGAPQPHQQPEGGERVERRPLGADRQAEAHARGQQPRPEQQPADRPEPGAVGRRRRRAASRRPEPVAVGDQAGAPPAAGRRPRRCRAAPSGTAPAAGRRRSAAGRRRRPAASSRSAAARAGTSPAPSASPTTAAETRQPSGSIPNAVSPERDQPLADLGVDDHRRVVGPDARRRARPGSSRRRSST